MTNLQRFNELLNLSGKTTKDWYYSSLFWIIANDDDLYNNKNRIFDFEEGAIVPEVLDEAFITSGTKTLINLGFNLFNGFGGADASPYYVFGSLDQNGWQTAYDAIFIRFNGLNDSMLEEK